MSDGMQLTRRKALPVVDASAGKKIFGTKHSLSIPEATFNKMFKEISGIQPSHMANVMMEVRRTILMGLSLGGTMHVPGFGVIRAFGSGTENQADPTEDKPIELQVKLLVDKSLKKEVATPGVIPYSVVQQAQIIPLISSVKDLGTGTFDTQLTPDGLLKIVGTNLKFNPTKNDEGIYLIPTVVSDPIVKFSKMQDPQTTRLLPAVPVELVAGATYQIEVRTRPNGTRELRIGRYTPIFTVV